MSKSEIIQQVIEANNPLIANLSEESAEGSVVCISGCKRWTHSWPEFDFRGLPLCQASRNQLANIYDYVCAKGTPLSIDHNCLISLFREPLFLIEEFTYQFPRISI
jgi:hypothetical protein